MYRAEELITHPFGTNRHTVTPRVSALHSSSVRRISVFHQCRIPCSCHRGCRTSLHHVIHVTRRSQAGCLKSSLDLLTVQLCNRADAEVLLLILAELTVSASALSWIDCLDVTHVWTLAERKKGKEKNSVCSSFF